jgi:hypothetical protein
MISIWNFFQYRWTGLASALAVSGLVLAASSVTAAAKVIRAEIQTFPSSKTSGASNMEFGLIYSDTGLIPAHLVLYCQSFIDDTDWNGVAPQGPSECGRVDLQLRLTSVGLSLFLLNYSVNSPPTIQLHIDPETTPVRAVLGAYTGAKAAVGLAAGFRAVIFRNDASNVWATLGLTMVPVSNSSDRWYDDLNIGLDVSVPWLEVYLKTPTNLNQSIAKMLPSLGQNHL